MKHIVITGSSRGIGFGLAGEFLKNKPQKSMRYISA